MPQEPLANLVLTAGANAESGIDLTVLRCTFYRNFVAFYAGALGILDAWPSVVNMVDNTCKIPLVMFVDLPLSAR